MLYITISLNCVILKSLDKLNTIVALSQILNC